MQQTETYKLNLVEPTDPFSPGPLNENAQKTEAALAALSARTVTLENCRIVVGQYTGTGKEHVIDLGERPIAVIASFWAAHLGYTTVVAGDMVAYGSRYPALKLVDNGFWISDIFGSVQAEGYSYIALLGDWPVKNVGYPKTT